MGRGVKRFAIVIVAVIATISIDARAGDHAEAERLFLQGRELVRAGRFAEAILKFEASLRAEETASALLNLADCHEKLGHYASAVRVFRRIESRGDPDRAAEAKRRADALEPSVPTLVIRAPSATADVEVRLDGDVVAPGTLGTAMPLDSGEHRVVASAHCKRPFDTRVKIPPAGGKTELVVPLLAEDPACQTKTRSPPPEEPPSTPWRTIGVITGATGLATVGVGSVFGVIALGHETDLTNACTSYPNGCPPSRRDEIEGTYDDARSSATVANVAFVTGALLIVAGAALYLLAPKTTTTASR